MESINNGQLADRSIQEKSIDEIELQNTFVPYPKSLLDEWKNGNYSMLMSSNASDYIKKILLTKARKRPGTRFFGEAYIASTIDMVHGWYNSYKWLTADKWLSGNGLEPEFEQPFYDALVKHIGLDVLSNLQRRSMALYERHKEKSVASSRNKKPVAPDLWLIDRDGRFSFIESKLPDDTIESHQLAGLALIKRYLNVPNPVSVTIVNLYPEHLDPPSEFSEYYDLT